MERFFTFSNFSKFPEIIHGISNRSFGDMRFGKIAEEEVIKNRKIFFEELGIDISEVVVPTLAHGTKIKTVEAKDKGRGSTADGLITQDKNLYLMVTVADCLPIFIYDPILKIVGVFHAGWRGIIGQIVLKAIEKFKTLGTDPENILVGVGPGICQKHFVVSNDVLNSFLEIYPFATFVRNNHGYVDLKKAVRKDLIRIGILEENMEISNTCPACENGLYGSFRKEGQSAPAAAAVIGMKK